MARRYFADTYYFLALLAPDDEARDEAIALANSLSPALVTTDAVLLELADALSSPRDREMIADYIRALWQDPRVEVHAVDRALMTRGIDLYAARGDKKWSLTDCISFVVMEEEDIGQALTGDVHFQQAGFRILFDAR